MSGDLTDCILRGLVVLVPLIVLFMLSGEAIVAMSTYERRAIKRGKLLSAAVLCLAAIHPVYLFIRPGFDVPVYYFASPWLVAVPAVPYVRMLARAGIEARRGKWRSPRYGELSKPRSEEAESKWIR